MKAAQDIQKSYNDLRRWPDEFEAGDKVLLRVSPMKGVVRFGARRKLSPRFIGPYDIVEKVGKLAYRLALPNALGKVHDVFHISQLKRYVAASSHVRSTRRRDITMVKVLWSNHRSQEATWETEDSMRGKYPHLFSQYVMDVHDVCGILGVVVICSDGESATDYTSSHLRRPFFCRHSI
ncbi:uncharacterized protein LOC130824918 [Amaranthus tricolor]|uniref:uncharacterized protein LOC130824918 n=1 Tax=Amaranthus tricolor TaxID=29722 RepID=UPI0025888A79|nr:uncharacterized protein LOC130824918 [Amaranthus tricolor]